MAVNITDADSYISSNVIDVDDWLDSDNARKQRILNVAEERLKRRYSDYVIPDNAVYGFAAVVSVIFNDTLKQKQYGVSTMSISGITFNFRDSGNRPLETYIPQPSLDLIGDANGVKLSTARVGNTVL
jgi:hypothetical protein